MIYRPKIKLELTSFDKSIEWICISLLIFSFATTAFFYGQLSEMIPTHFNGSGEVDGHGDKSMLFLLPIIATVMYSGLRYLNKFPHIFNIPVKITEQNAETEYRRITRMIRFLNLSMTIMFLYINFTMAQTALGNMNGLGSNFSLISTFLFLGPIAIYLIGVLRKS